jgi:cytochrome c oxidase cbb3-type subunit III
MLSKQINKPSMLSAAFLLTKPFQKYLTMPGIQWYKIKQVLFSKTSMALALGLFSSPWLMAEGGGHPPKEPSIYDPFILVMVIIMGILLLAIGLLANVVIGAAGYYYKNHKTEDEKPAGSAAAILGITTLLFFSAPVLAQDTETTTAAVTAVTGINGVSPTTYYLQLTVIGVELLVIFALLYQLRVFLVKQKARALATAGPHPNQPGQSYTGGIR